MNEVRLEIVFTNALQIATAPIGHQIMVITYKNFSVSVEGNHVMYTLPVDHLVRMQVKYYDSAGNPAKVDGDVHWESSDDDLAAVDVDSADSSICTVTGLSQLGQVQIVAIADADMGDGTRQIRSIADIEIVAGEAVVGTISPMGESEPVEPHVQPRGKAS